jgi:hypothetical protein
MKDKLKNQISIKKNLFQSLKINFDCQENFKY